MQGEGAGLLSEAFWGKGDDEGGKPWGDQGTEAQAEGTPVSVLRGEQQDSRMPGKKGKAERRLRGIGGGSTVVPLGQGWSLRPREGCEHATREPEGTVSGHPRRGVPQTGTQCDNSRGSGSPPLLMFKVLASPAFPLSTIAVLKVAGRRVPDVGQGAASPQEGRQRPRHSAQPRLWSPARCPVQ